jgi:ATP-dependent DNA helicase RecQ
MTTATMTKTTRTATESSPAHILRQTFGYREFRDHQEGIVDALLEGRDALAVMPTGAGKSLCYQLPAICRAGTCVVISPLISLMKDQVDKLRKAGVKAAFLNSTLDSDQQATVMDRLKQHCYDIIYVAPERFAVDAFRDALDTMTVALFAVDEAHCISEWGHDFRPDYLVLSELTKRYPEVPVAAFTATATPRDQEQIAFRLGLRAPHLVRASFNRRNLFYEVTAKTDDLGQILDFVQSRPGQSGIVYRGTRRAVEETAEFLRMSGVDALPYHAGMESDVRRKHQEAFISNRCPIIVATIAFGMGIDKPDVRFVVHGDLPKSVDGYYQETGRAGRDGDPAHCLLLFSMTDVPRARFFVNKIKDAQEHRNASIRLDAMVRYAKEDACRRRALLGYFGERYGRRTCRGCDVCSPRQAFGSVSQSVVRGLRTATLFPTLKLLKAGLSYAQIAARRGLKPTTIAGHIVELSTKGERFDVDVHVEPPKRKLIESLFATHGMDRLKPAVEAAHGRVTYDEARLVRAAIRG